MADLNAPNVGVIGEPGVQVGGQGLVVAEEEHAIAGFAAGQHPARAKRSTVLPEPAMPKTTWWPEPSDRAACSCWASSTSSVTAPRRGAFAPAIAADVAGRRLTTTSRCKTPLRVCDCSSLSGSNGKGMREQPLEPADDLAVAGVF